MKHIFDIISLLRYEGGTISMGGIGFMSHKFGIQAGHVKEIELVSGLGDVLHCSEKIRPDLFDTVRGGLGNFGIITSLQIPLIKAPTQIAIFKGFYQQEIGTKRLAEEMKAIIDFSCVDMIHTFIKPSTNVKDIIGDEVFKASSQQFRCEFHNQMDEQKVVFFIECGCYVWNDDQSDDEARLAKVRNMLSELSVIDGAFFEERMDFYTYITRDPPVVCC